jgi:hypothetical protein
VKLFGTEINVQICTFGSYVLYFTWNELVVLRNPHQLCITQLPRFGYKFNTYYTRPARNQILHCTHVQAVYQPILGSWSRQPCIHICVMSEKIPHRVIRRRPHLPEVNFHCQHEWNACGLCNARLICLYYSRLVYSADLENIIMVRSKPFMKRGSTKRVVYRLAPVSVLLVSAFTM